MSNLLTQIGLLPFLSMVVATFESFFTDGLRIREVIRHLDDLAYRSLNIIVVCVSFAAAISILEASYHMKLIINNDSLVPGFAAMLIVRELAVVVTCLLLAAKIGAGIAAEVGQMKVSEQIDALRLLGINPLNFLILPRFFACLFAGLVLSLIANGVCLLAAVAVTVYELDQSIGFFSYGLPSLCGRKRFGVLCDKRCRFLWNDPFDQLLLWFQLSAWGFRSWPRNNKKCRLFLNCNNRNRLYVDVYIFVFLLNKGEARCHRKQKSDYYFSWQSPLFLSLFLFSADFLPLDNIVV